MDTPETIERKLNGLIPSGFSEAGALELDSLIDELAGEEAVGLGRWAKLVIWSSATAAAGIALALGLVLREGDGSFADELVLSASGVQLLSAEEGVISAEAGGGLVLGSDGSLHREWRVQVVNEELFHDEQTGNRVRVVHPREEVVLMPVTAF